MDARQIRDSKIPLPGRDDGYARIMFVGTTGAGKTTLLRHLIGSDHTNDRFPSISTARTTTSDIEIVTADSGPFTAAITFIPFETVIGHVEECIQAACRGVIEGDTTKEVAHALLNHPEQRFRLSYVLGTLEEQTEDDDDLDFGFESPEPELPLDESVPPNERRRHADELKDLVNRVVQIATVEEANTSAQVGFSLSSGNASQSDEDWWAVFDRIIADSPNVLRLRGQILDRIEDRFDLLEAGSLETDSKNWPIVWTYESHDRSEFLRQVRWFSSNHHLQYGRLLTPLVDGVRVQGEFVPRQPELGVAPKLVLIDGEGLGHRVSSAESVSTHVTELFALVDRIVLVDNAQQPIVGPPLTLLRTVADRGQIAKLALTFTHFDLVRGDNINTQQQRVDHVRGSITNALSNLRGSISESVWMRLNARLSENTYFLGGLDRDTAKLPPGIIRHLRDFLSDLQNAAISDENLALTFHLNTGNIGPAIETGIRGFRRYWDIRLGIDPTTRGQKEHWTRIKALNRRLAELGTDEYDTLRPVAELSGSLQNQISNWLEVAADWHSPDASKDDKDKVLDAVRDVIGNKIQSFASHEIWRSQIENWGDANELSGRGSTFVRADRINQIYEHAVPVKRVATSVEHRVVGVVEEAQSEVLNRIMSQERK